MTGSTRRPSMPEGRQPLVVVVTGPPASGKTTLAELIASRCGLPLIAKDAIKETLFDSLGSGDGEWSKRLGRATFSLIIHFLEVELRAGRSAIVEANFDPRFAGPEFSRLREVVPFRLLQIHCDATQPTLLKRLSNRSSDGSRHPGHLDDI